MSIEFKIIIPSMGRADSVVTTSAVKNAILCVPESEEKDYAEHNPGVEIFTHPDSVNGLAAKRQFILERCGNHYQIDDDVKNIQRVYTESGEETKLDADEAYDIIQYIGNCANLAGCKVFGMGKEQNPLIYNEFKPISLTGAIMGSMGFIEGSKLYFHPKLSLCDDYWMCALNAYLYRYLWIDNRFSEKVVPTFGNKGGCGHLRTIDAERDETLLLRQCFGEAIVLKQDTVLAKRKFEYQRTLRVPF